MTWYAIAVLVGAVGGVLFNAVWTTCMELFDIWREERQ